MTRFFPITLRPVKSRPNLKQPQNKYRYGKTLKKNQKTKKKKNMGENWKRWPNLSRNRGEKQTRYKSNEQH